MGATRGIIAGAVIGAFSIFSVQALRAEERPKPLNLSAGSAEERYPLPEGHMLPTTPIPQPSGAPSPIILLPKLDCADAESTVAISLRYLLATHLRAAQPGKRYLVVLPGWAWREPYSNNMNPTAQTRPSDAYAADAASLGATLTLTGAVTPSKVASSALDVRLTLHKTERPSSRTLQVTLTPTNYGDEVSKILREIATDAGLNDEDIKAAGILEDVPKSPATWKCFSTINLDGAVAPPNDQTFQAALQADPKSPILLSYGIQSSKKLEDINKLIDRRRGDYRLIFEKSTILEDDLDLPMPAVHLMVHALQTCPDNFVILAAIAKLPLGRVFTVSGQSATPIEQLTALAETVDQYASKHPKSWAAQWIAALALDAVACIARGTETADKIGERNSELFRVWGRRAAKRVYATKELRDDLSNWYGIALGMLALYGYNDLDEQRKWIERAEQVDPNNPAPALAVAYYHSIGWDYPSIHDHIMRDTIKRFANTKHNKTLILSKLLTNFHRLHGFTNVPITDLYKDPSGLGKDTAELVRSMLETSSPSKIYSQNPHSIYTAYCILKAHGDWDNAFRLVDLQDFNVLSYQALDDLHAKNDWPRLEKHARSGISAVHGDGINEPRARYYILKAEWKQGKTDDALRDCEAGIKRFPNSYLFPYMFANIALDKNVRLAEALNYAKKAKELKPDQPGLDGTIKKLEAKIAAK